MNNLEFKKFIIYHKNKSADIVFQNGNFNNELIRYAITKVIKSEGITDNFLSQPKIDNNDSESKLSIYIFLTMVILSIGLIFIHYYLYINNPKKFFQRL